MNVIRSILFYLGYGVIMLITGLIVAPIALLTSKHRRFRILNFYNYSIMLWLRITCGIRINVHGKRDLPDAPCIIISNHQSEWETLYLQLLKPPTCTVLKKELLKIPVFGWLLRLINPIAIDRSHPSKAFKAMMKGGQERVQEGFSVLMFPEGTRVTPGDRKPFSKSGVMMAQKAGAQIIPVAHNGGEHWLTGSWIKKPGVIDVVVGEAIDTVGRPVNDVQDEVVGWIDAQLDEIISVPRPQESLKKAGGDSA